MSEYLVPGAAAPGWSPEVEPGADWVHRPATTGSTAATAVGVRLAAGRAILVGFSFIETTGASPATADLLDGLDANGGIIAAISLTPGQSVRDWFAVPGIVVRRGLFLNVLSGSVRGAAWFVPRGMP